VTPIDERLLKAMIGLRHDDRFKTVLAWLSESLADQDHKTRRLSGDALIRAQGESLCLERVLEIAGNADKLLKP
jgi:hypothetical protein